MRTFIRDERDMCLNLKRALLIYEGSEQAYVTAHGILVKNKRPEIGPGVPVNRVALAGLLEKLTAETALAGFLPDRMLYMGPTLIAWWRPPASARVWFDAQRDKGLIGKRSAITPHPGLVFIVAGEHWFVHAVPGKDRPQPATKLLRAPYFNVWDSGEICTGNAKLPDAMSPAVIEGYERAFFDSRFTHPNVHKGLTKHKGGTFRLWRELLDGKHTAFPEASLVSAGGTLETLIKKLEKRQSGPHD